MRPALRWAAATRSDREDERQAAGDERHAGAASGSPGWMNGALPWRATGLAAALLFAICTVNALSLIDKATRLGETYEAWRAFGEEYSSWLGMLLALMAPAVASLGLDRGRPAKKLALVLGSALLFCLVHTGVMVALRVLLWPIWGQRYVFHVMAELPFEFRKDVLTFTMLLAAMLVEQRWPRAAPVAPPQPEALPCGTAELEDGARTVLVTLETLCAAEAVGNYVELVRCDGGRQVLRTTLSAVEQGLGSAGFLRVHRRWLVSGDHVIAFTSSGNGDWRATLPGGLVVPVSRRQSAAIQRLRGRRSAAPAPPKGQAACSGQ